MEHHEVIIVGGGPAGSSCARKLVKAGVDCLVIDKAEFPRLKLCAGWITPQVVRDLEIDVATYPHSFAAYKAILAGVFGFSFRFQSLQHSIRRTEFDHWLLKRSGAPVSLHTAKNIVRHLGRYEIDNRFTCHHIVGAGGTNCPVRRSLFDPLDPRIPADRVVCRELEFECPPPDSACRLWFFENNLPGYSWYVPKSNNFVNIGVGGSETVLKKKRASINDHWNRFLDKLIKIYQIPVGDLNPKGYSYYRRSGRSLVHLDKAYLVGDAAGLATRDLCEGIGPAVQSGHLAADCILGNSIYAREILKIPNFSINRQPLRLLRPFLGWY